MVSHKRLLLRKLVLHRELYRRIIIKRLIERKRCIQVTGTTTFLERLWIKTKPNIQCVFQSHAGGLRFRSLTYMLGHGFLKQREGVLEQGCIQRLQDSGMRELEMVIPVLNIALPSQFSFLRLCVDSGLFDSN